MIKKKIFVNNTAATSGGALSILKQYLEQFSKDSDVEYYVFCTGDFKEYEAKNVHIINNIKGKKYIDRLKWDLFGMRNWSREKNIIPDEILSLQNTKVFGFRQTQTIYLHQSLPYYSEYKWNIFKKDERILWFYQNIYSKLIDISLKSCNVIVQTEWMKKRVMQRNKKQDNEIEIVKPTVNKINIESIPIISNIDKSKINLFYPASHQKYKNHKVLFDAIKELSDDYVLYITTDSELLKNYVSKNGINNKVIFLGEISYYEVLSYYKSTDYLVFPSYIETYGLPLVEAQQFDLSIVASDLDYAREVLKGYTKCQFVDYKNHRKWIEALERIKYDN